MATRKPVSRRTRFEVLKRDGFRCAYCGCGPPKSLLVVDHINPVALGGTNEPSNLVTACEHCNQGKSDRPLPASVVLATLPKALEPVEVWREGGRVYLPRNFNRRLPKTISGAARWSLLDHINNRLTVPGTYRHMGVNVVVHGGQPPRELWADPARGVL